MSTLELRRLGKCHERGEWAVREVDLTIADGELFVIVGPSGCGKSTLLRVIAGLDDATTGDVLIDGRSVRRTRPNERNIALAFQEYALYPHLTVAQNLGFPMRVGHVHEAIVERRIVEVASALRLTDVLDRRPRQLSGGQRQRVALGRAIVRQPRLLLMDEPLSNLDAKLRMQMRFVIMRLQRRLGLTTLYVTHDQDEAMAMGDRLAVMREGGIEQRGAPIDVYEHPQNVFVGQFVGSPSMNLLDASIVASGDAVELHVGRAALRFTHAQLESRPAIRRLAGWEVRLGVRPDSLLADPVGPLLGSVLSTEVVERQKLVHLDVDGTAMVMTVPATTPVSLWEPCRLRVDLARIHLFDPLTGVALA